MTKLDYLENTYLFESEAKVIKIWENEFWKYIILDKTIFYPQGWWQPSDIGKIILWEKIFEVNNVRLDKDWTVYHYWDGTFLPLENLDVKIEINKETRIKNAKNHTAWHILDIAVKNIWLDLIAKKWFHFNTWCYVEYYWIYNTEQKEEILRKLNIEINKLVSQNLKVNIQNNLDWQTPEWKIYRQVYFENYKNYWCGCGGTHLNYTWEIWKIEVTNIKNKKWNCKISYKVI